MSLLLSEDALVERKRVAAGALKPLADSLAADLEPLFSRDLYIPAEKALLSREGGRCVKDGTLLSFDPFEPHVHVCPRCSTSYRGHLHDRYWIYWYQLWLAERAVHAATLARLGVDDRFHALAAAILNGYAERYASYPNVDNVLGPTRLFFSTYLESIWLLQICVATDLLAPLDPALADRIRDRIIEPSRAIIREYDEGGSNRQIWNDAALLAAARLLGDQVSAEQAVNGPSGIVEQLSTRLLADGTWYEGDNYHLFAHRGLWYGVTMAEHAGAQLPSELVGRFQRGFSTVFATALPDFTFPSRRDSQYAVSLRQWRIAEHVELGLARRDDDQLIGALERIYRNDIPRRETGRRSSSADAERNVEASSLTRADLSWRALLCAREQLPPLEPVAPRSVLLERQGLAVFRRNEGRTYIGLDYGHSGGGHGHPDRLNLLLVDGDTRWLDDPGTGSYVEDTLHWYRSTLAHNAPLVDGRSQQRIDGDLAAYDERGGAGWIEASLQIGGTTIRRTIVAVGDYVVDRLAWQSARSVQIDLPMHADLSPDDVGTPEVLAGEQGLEDGFRFLHSTSMSHISAQTTVRGSAELSDRALRTWTQIDQPAEWWRAVAPGPPGQGERPFRVLRARGASGTITSVLAWSAAVIDVQLSDVVDVELSDRTTHRHRGEETGWRIDLLGGAETDSIELGGRVVGELRVVSRADPVQRCLIAPTTIAMGESHYRRSEQSWIDAGRPIAEVSLRPNAGGLHIEIHVSSSDRNFVAADAINPYDNESPDVNSDGVQLFVRTPEGNAGWMLVPEHDGERVRVRAIEGWRSPQSISATWASTANGYVMTIALATCPDAIDVIVNETPRGRERRRGQLVLSGGGGFVYLRGDRHDEGALVRLDVTHG
jgi:hypothetical protein